MFQTGFHCLKTVRVWRDCQVWSPPAEGSDALNKWLTCSHRVEWISLAVNTDILIEMISHLNKWKYASWNQAALDTRQDICVLGVIWNPSKSTEAAAFSIWDVTEMESHSEQHSTSEKWLFLHVPYPVGGRRRDVDSQRSLEFLHLHSEQKGRVRHFLHLLFDELRLCGLLEVFGLGDLVHEAHDLAGFVASGPTLVDTRRI